MSTFSIFKISNVTLLNLLVENFPYKQQRILYPTVLPEERAFSGKLHISLNYSVPIFAISFLQLKYLE